MQSSAAFILRDSRRTVRDTLEFLVQGEDELGKREALARVSVNGHLGDGGGWSLKGKVELCRIEPITPRRHPRPTLAHPFRFYRLFLSAVT